jgi:large subunit ribosomal protein L10e
MTTKPSRCFRNITNPSYTRKEYIGRYPNLPDALKQFSYGNTKEVFPAKISLIAMKDGQVGDRAIASVRVTINTELKSCVGENDYRLDIRPIPWQVVRGHGLLGVAKAERLMKGMRESFGNPINRVARIHKGQALFEVGVRDTPVTYGVGKRILDRAKKRLPPLDWQIKVEGISLSTQHANVTLPTRKKEKKSTGGQAAITRDVKS